MVRFGGSTVPASHVTHPPLGISPSLARIQDLAKLAKEKEKETAAWEAKLAKMEKLTKEKEREAAAWEAKLAKLTEAAK